MNMPSMTRVSVAVALLAIGTSAFAYEGELKRGRLYFRQICTSCHQEMIGKAIAPNERLKADWGLHQGRQARQDRQEPSVGQVLHHQGLSRDDQRQEQGRRETAQRQRRRPVHGRPGLAAIQRQGFGQSLRLQLIVAGKAEAGGAARPAWLEGLRKDYHDVLVEQWSPYLGAILMVAILAALMISGQFWGIFGGSSCGATGSTTPSASARGSASSPNSKARCRIACR
ncbi:MAG: hypothetical protein IPG52_03585 [Rhodocyclaceae bacterium]|nr:hypothetical protein [Rhodocyclaceae bacterium]